MFGRDVPAFLPLRLPAPAALAALRADLEWACQASRETVDWTAGLAFPPFEGTYLFLALYDPETYAVLSGTIRASSGEDVAVDAYDTFMHEEQVVHATALHGLSREHGPVMVGPMARFNLHCEHLSAGAREAAAAAGFHPPCANPFKSIVIRSLEMLHACERVLELIERYSDADDAWTAPVPFPGTGCGGVEAPRGLCWHKYHLDDRGRVLDARIVAPTTQNLRMMETDLSAFATRFGHLDPERLAWQCEQLVRSYDPCISCSSHVAVLHG